jgi:hypothetical protein
MAQAERVTLATGDAGMSWELNGGGLVDFHLAGGNLNPFTWDDGTKDAARFLGHFICLDRWGAPSAAELKNGMPFHGEAPRVVWRSLSKSSSDAAMSAQLPMAHLSVKRTVHLEASAAVVTEAVTNEAPLGRVYNFVQHPTIAPPFLDESVVVDANARRGFMQSSPMPNPEHPEVVWPQALEDGKPVNLRHLTNDPEPNVVSFVIDEPYGWTTAVNAAKGLLVGYVWRVSEYPWFNVWRDVKNGRPAARGLEFGTTGLHQPYPELTKKGRIFGRPLFEYIDTHETIAKKYEVFLLKVPAAYTGTSTIRKSGADWELTGRDGTKLTVRNLLD